MLGNIFRPRRSTAVASPAFQTEPTTAKPTAPKAPSKLLTKLKELKKVIRSNPLTKKGSKAAHENSKKGSHKLTSSNETLADGTPTTRTALDHEYRKVPPVPHPHNLGPITPSFNALPGTTNPIVAPFLAPAPNFPINYLSAPLAPAHHVLPRHQQLVPIPHVEAEVLAARSPLAALAAFERDFPGDGMEEIKVKLSKQPQRAVIHTAPVVRSYSAEIYPHYPTEGQFVPASNVLPKLRTAGPEEHNNRRDPSRVLQQGRQNCKNGAMDFNERLARYRNEGLQKPVQHDRNAGSEETCQAGADEDSEDDNSSYDHPNQAPTPEPSLWLGKRFF
ncbi:hypothetical protein FS837_010587 [Tulasnella sp. UAMH 9824]|nr:hypothetical protein FS837_010587 [Tulasnella sp. UAMH 9824]